MDFISVIVLKMQQDTDYWIQYFQDQLKDWQNRRDNYRKAIESILEDLYREKAEKWKQQSNGISTGHKN